MPENLNLAVSPGLKQNHEIAGITNCEITKCGNPLYYGPHGKNFICFHEITDQWDMVTLEFSSFLLL